MGPVDILESCLTKLNRLHSAVFALFASDPFYIRNIIGYYLIAYYNCPPNQCGATADRRTRDREVPGSKLAYAICFFSEARKLIGNARWPSSARWPNPEISAGFAVEGSL